VTQNVKKKYSGLGQLESLKVIGKIGKSNIL